MFTLNPCVGALGAVIRGRVAAGSSLEPGTVISGLLNSSLVARNHDSAAVQLTSFPVLLVSHAHSLAAHFHDVQTIYPGALFNIRPTPIQIG